MPTLGEIVEAIRTQGFKPLDIFSENQLTSDPLFTKLVDATVKDKQDADGTKTKVEALEKQNAELADKLKQREGEDSRRELTGKLPEEVDSALKEKNIGEEQKKKFKEHVVNILSTDESINNENIKEKVEGAVDTNLKFLDGFGLKGSKEGDPPRPPEPDQSGDSGEDRPEAFKH